MGMLNSIFSGHTSMLPSHLPGKLEHAIFISTLLPREKVVSTAIPWASFWAYLHTTSISSISVVTGGEKQQTLLALASAESRAAPLVQYVHSEPETQRR